MGCLVTLAFCLLPDTALQELVNVYAEDTSQLLTLPPSAALMHTELHSRVMLLVSLLLMDALGLGIAWHMCRHNAHL